MNAHITVQPELRRQRSIDHGLRFTITRSAESARGMPEEIIRSYLVNPFLDSSRTFCTGCRNDISQKIYLGRRPASAWKPISNA